VFRNNYITIVGIITALISYTEFSWEMVQKAARVSSLPHGIVLDCNKKHKAKASHFP